MKKNNNILAILFFWLATLCQIAHAEISGSGSPNSGCLGELNGLLWLDTDADGVADAAEPGLANVSLELVYEDGNVPIATTTNAAGYYQFNYLCAGDYIAVIDEATLPDGVLVPDNDDDDSSDEDLGGWAVEIGDDDDEAIVTINRGYVGCELSVNASCKVASLASELYRCEKPIDVLSLIWNGEQDIRVVAHRGNKDSTVLADIDNVAQGDLVTVSGIAGSPSDVIWEIFEAGTDTKLGESKFRMDCDDVEMDGPEDCGMPQGDGRDNKADRINDWILEGIVDDSGILECTNRRAAAETCESQSTWADCELIDKVNWLTFAYTGGGCSASEHEQPDKFECAGEIDSDSAATVLTESGDSFQVLPGGSFTIPTEGGDTDIVLSNAHGTQDMRIHTSCSKPLAAGDIYGSLTLLALNGLGIGAQIDYDYELENKGNSPVTANALEAPFRTVYQPSIAIAPQAVRHVAGSAYVMETTTSAMLAERNDGSSELCEGADFVGVIVTPPAPCEISGSGLMSHDHDILWDLSTGNDASAAVERIEISWPTSVTDKLKEIKLGGDKIFDQDLYGGVAIIEKSDLMGELKDRRISRNALKQMKIVFDDDVDQTPLDDFRIEVFFKQGCSISNQVN